MENTDSIIYNQLPYGNIRLLRLGGTQTCGPVGALEVVPLSHCSPYYTLSHCWGSERSNIPLLLKDGTLFINSELAAAIERLRSLDSSAFDKMPHIEYVWIDRICINQSDVSERSVQVSLMGQIFSQSIRTLIWLGTNVGQCPSAWRLVEKVYQVCMEENPGIKSIVDIPFKLYSEINHTKSGLPNFYHQDWKSFDDFMRAPWFTRIWVIQEIVLSSKDPIILHGEHFHSWDCLGWTASWLRRNGFFRLSHFPQTVRNVDEISNIRRSREKWPLDALLAATSVKFHATDQRDKVYALFGIASETQDIGVASLQPDYRLRVDEVYKRTARFLLGKKKSLAIILRTLHMSTYSSQPQHVHKITQLPTWVPNWSDFGLSDRDIMKSLSWLAYTNTPEPATLGFPAHCAASAGRTAILDTTDENVLGLRGIKFDTIHQTLPFNKPDQSNKEFTENFASTLSIILRELISFCKGKRVIEWLAEFIRATTTEQNQLSGRSRELLLKDGSAYIVDLLSKSDKLRLIYQIAEPNIMDLLRHLAVGGDAATYSALATIFCFGRAFLITSRQFLGLGPANTHSSDLVTILYGGDIPYVLRKCDCRWELVGDSYFPALNSGQAISFGGLVDTREETFLLQ